MTDSRVAIAGARGRPPRASSVDMGFHLLRLRLNNSQLEGAGSEKMRRRGGSSLLLPIYLLLLSTILVIGQGRSVNGNFHTEGGNFKLPSSGQQHPPQYFDDVENPAASAADFLLQQREQEAIQQREGDLANIVEELKQIRRSQELYDELSGNANGGQDLDGIPVLDASSNQRLSTVADQQQQQQEDNGEGPELEELRRFGNKIRELTQAKLEKESPEKPQQEEIVEKPTKEGEVEEDEGERESEEEEKKQPMIQKKGQSEFVEFVEPTVVHSSKKLRNKEILEKRIASEDERYHSRQHSKYRAFNFISSSGNVIFVAFVTMCCVFSVVGVVGGMYYYNHIRTNREDPFDDFTRYSPAGPGRDKLKKGGGGGGRGLPPAFGGFEKGDESLAYKAQLHHYQQTKQKIIGEQGTIVGGGCDPDDASDKSDDDEADLEHNFSVYECPGLAPTGDIEVQNPNFVESPTTQKKPSLTGSISGSSKK